MMEVVKEVAAAEKGLKGANSLKGEIKEEEKLQQLVKLLAQFKVNFPIREMMKKSPYCIKFMTYLLLPNGKPLEDAMIVVTKGCSTVFEDKPRKKKEDPGRFSIPVTIEDFLFNISDM